jgi:hypothetical protein
MTSGHDLKVGTLGAEYIVDSSDLTFTDANLRIRQQTNNGSDDNNAIQMSNFTFYTSRDGRKLRSFRFNNDNGSYISDNMNTLADHIISHGYGGASIDNYAGIKFTYCVHHPSRSLIWALNSNNKLIGITISSESGFSGWHKHEIGGTDVSITGITVIPGDSGYGDSFDTLYAVVSRTINSVTKYYLETMMFDFEHDHLKNTSTAVGDAPYYSDSAFREVFLSAKNTVSGLGHLEGETVKVLVDGEVHPDRTVSSGAITLDATYPIATQVFVGLSYTATLTTMPVEAGQELETAQGQVKHIDRATVKFFKSKTGKIGISETELEDIDMASLFSGDQIVHLSVDPDTENQIVIQSTNPLPMGILGIVYRGVTYGG